MNTKLLFIISSFVAAPVFGMESGSSNSTQQLLPWVAAASTVHIKSLKLNTTVSIDDRTTVRDIKSQLFNREGIPVDQQSLCPIVSKYFGFSQEFRGALSNNEYVKKAMNEHNTDRFQLYLSLRISRNLGKDKR